MTNHALLFVVALLAALAFLALRRANEVAALSVRRGRVLLYRGHVPQALVNDVADAVRRGQVAEATVRIVKENRRPTLLIAGPVDDATKQVLRNLLQTHAHRLMARAVRAGAPPGRRNLGQRLGIASLAWWLHERER